MSDQTIPPRPGTDTGDKNTTDADDDELPVRRLQNTDLVDAPRRGIRVVVERGASMYFSTCRRIARFLNQRE